MTDMRLIRQELKLTQAELAEQLGVHQATISRFETGEQPLDRRTELALLALKNNSEPTSEAA
jgi:transcriptional regulator with XRE-family HTH domain